MSVEDLINEANKFVDDTQATIIARQNSKLVQCEAALKLVLLFHSGAPFNAEGWEGLCHLLPITPNHYEATTENMCDKIRAVLNG